MLNWNYSLFGAECRVLSLNPMSHNFCLQTIIGKSCLKILLNGARHQGRLLFLSVSFSLYLSFFFSPFPSKWRNWFPGMFCYLIPSMVTFLDIAQVIHQISLNLPFTSTSTLDMISHNGNKFSHLFTLSDTKFSTWACLLRLWLSNMQSCHIWYNVHILPITWAI